MSQRPRIVIAQQQRLALNASLSSAIRMLRSDAAGLARPGELGLASADQSLAFDLIADGRPRWLRVDVRDGAGKLVLIGNPIYLRP